LTAIFGFPKESLTLTRNQSDFIAFTSLLARRRILLVWSSATPPAVAAWLRDILLFLKPEKVKFKLKGSVQKFYSKWQPFVTYFENLKVLPEVCDTFLFKFYFFVSLFPLFIFSMYVYSNQWSTTLTWWELSSL